MAGKQGLAGGPGAAVRLGAAPGTGKEGSRAPCSIQRGRASVCAAWVRLDARAMRIVSEGAPARARRADAPRARRGAVQAQCILYRRYPGVLAPFKYAGYPLLLAAVTLPPDEDTAAAHFLAPERAPLLQVAPQSFSRAARRCARRSGRPSAAEQGGAAGAGGACAGGQARGMPERASCGQACCAWPRRAPRRRRCSVGLRVARDARARGARQSAAGELALVCGCSPYMLQQAAHSAGVANSVPRGSTRSGAARRRPWSCAG